MSVWQSQVREFRFILDKEVGTGAHALTPCHTDPIVTVLALLEALQADGLPVALQDAVAGDVGDAEQIPLLQVKDLLVGAGVGLAAAKRIAGRLSAVRVL